MSPSISAVFGSLYSVQNIKKYKISLIKITVIPMSVGQIYLKNWIRKKLEPLNKMKKTVVLQQFLCKVCFVIYKMWLNIRIPIFRIYIWTSWPLQWYQTIHCCGYPCCNPSHCVHTQPHGNGPLLHLQSGISETKSQSSHPLRTCYQSERD